MHFLLDEAEIQGTWSHTSPSGARVTLVTFDKEATITHMMYRDRLTFRKSNVSLTINRLNVEDEGDYHLNINIEFHNKTGLVIKEERTVHVTVDGKCFFRPWQPVLYCYGLLDLPIFLASSVPVSSAVIEKSPSYPVVEDKANVTWTCSVEKGTRVAFQWLRDNAVLSPTDRYHFSRDNSTLFISPVKKEDKGSYRCVVSNPVSYGQSSRAMELTVYCE